jgi:hypothetical protein
MILALLLSPVATLARAQAVPPAAQSEQGSRVSGVAQSSDGRPLAAALVLLRNQGTGVAMATSRTDDSGRFVFEFTGGGQFIVELLSSSDRIQSTSPRVTVAPGASVTTVVTQSAGVTIDGVMVGQTVWVTTANGAEVRGKVVTLSPAVVDLETTEGTRRIATSDVWRVAKTDGSGQGLLIGALVGTLGGIAVGRREADIYRRGHPGEPTPLAWLVTLGGTLVGASAGAWIDNLIEGREIMYQNPGRTVAVKIVPALVLTRSKRLGLAGSITWR